MIREQVAIVLNEREPHKERAAGVLSARLAELGITSSRLPITPELAKNILGLNPRIVVIDYLLGDYTTGLDVLAELNEQSEGLRPEVLFLTDEPSVPVAVQALKLGASEYFEMDHPQAMEQTLRQVASLLLQQPVQPPRRARQRAILSDLVASAAASRDLVVQTRLVLAKRSPIILICGPGGSGKSTLAEALLREGELMSGASPSYTLKLDLRTYDRPYSDLLNERLNLSFKLGKGLSLQVENPDEDGGELLDFLSRSYEDVWQRFDPASNNSRVAVCLKSSEEIGPWQARLPAEVLMVPSLADRAEDIAPLAQRFAREAEPLTGRRLGALSSEALEFLRAQEWPLNIRQLRSILIDAAITSGMTGRSLIDSLRDCLESWTDPEPLTSRLEIDDYSAAAALEACGYDYRIAAAKLGCGVRELRALLAPYKREGA